MIGISVIELSVLRLEGAGWVSVLLEVPEFGTGQQ